MSSWTAPPPTRQQVIEAGIITRRERHAGLGHEPTSVVGYCAEPDGISATFCVEGFWLETLDRERAARADERRRLRERLDGLHVYGIGSPIEQMQDHGWNRALDRVLALLADPAADPEP